MAETPLDETHEAAFKLVGKKTGRVGIEGLKHLGIRNGEHIVEDPLHRVWSANLDTGEVAYFVGSPCQFDPT